MLEAPEMNPEDMLKLVDTKMPFGRYAGTALIKLPEPYVAWFYRNGLPEGELGKLLGLLYEVKANGLEYLFEPLKSENYGRPDI